MRLFCVSDKRGTVCFFLNFDSIEVRCTLLLCSMVTFAVHIRSCSATLSISYQIGHKTCFKCGVRAWSTQYEANKAESQSQFIIPFIEPILKNRGSCAMQWRHADFCVMAHVAFFLRGALKLPLSCPSRSHSNVCVCYFLWMCVHLQDDISIHEQDVSSYYTQRNTL